MNIHKIIFESFRWITILSLIISVITVLGVILWLLYNAILSGNPIVKTMIISSVLFFIGLIVTEVYEHNWKDKIK